MENLSQDKQPQDRFRGDNRRGLDWRLDLLITYTHDSELQSITALSLISTQTNHYHKLSSQPSLVVSWQRILVVSL
jgi:hypothetical protein